MFSKGILLVKPSTVSTGKTDPVLRTMVFVEEMGSPVLFCGKESLGFNAIG
jgi:hypothetical protein